MNELMESLVSGVVVNGGDKLKTDGNEFKTGYIRLDDFYLR